MKREDSTSSITKADLEQAIKAYSQDYRLTMLFKNFDVRGLFSELKKICKHSEDGPLDDISLNKLIAVLVFFGVKSSHVQPIIDKIDGSPRTKITFELIQEIYSASPTPRALDGKTENTFSARKVYLAAITHCIFQISVFLENVSSISEDDQLYAAFYLANLEEIMFFHDIVFKSKKPSYYIFIKKLNLLFKAIRIETYEKIHHNTRENNWLKNAFSGLYRNEDKRSPDPAMISSCKEVLRKPELSWLKVIVFVEKKIIDSAIGYVPMRFYFYREVVEVRAKVMLLLHFFPEYDNLIRGFFNLINRYGRSDLDLYKFFNELDLNGAVFDVLLEHPEFINEDSRVALKNLLQSDKSLKREELFNSLKKEYLNLRQVKFFNEGQKIINNLDGAFTGRLPAELVDLTSRFYARGSVDKELKSTLIEESDEGASTTTPMSGSN